MTKTSLEKKIVEVVGEWDDWKGLREDFHTRDPKEPNKGPDSYELRLKIGMKCKQKPEYSNKDIDITFLAGQKPDQVDGVMLPYAAEAEANVLEYTDKNFANMLNMLGRKNIEGLYSQALSIRPYKAMSAEHNKTVAIHNELSTLQYLLQHKDDPKAIRNMKYYLLSKATTAAGAASLEAYVVNNKENTLSMFASILESKNIQLQSRFMSGNELDEKRIAKYALNNIKRLQLEEYKEDNEDKRDDLKDEREAIYLNVAKTLLDKIKEED